VCSHLLLESLDFVAEAKLRGFVLSGLASLPSFCRVTRRPRRLLRGPGVVELCFCTLRPQLQGPVQPFGAKANSFALIAQD
jgi:hypothetical protein